MHSHQLSKEGSARNLHAALEQHLPEGTEGPLAGNAHVAALLRELPRAQRDLGRKRFQVGSRTRIIQQICQGSVSAASMPIFASRYTRFAHFWLAVLPKRGLVAFPTFAQFSRRDFLGSFQAFFQMRFQLLQLWNPVRKQPLQTYN